MGLEFIKAMKQIWSVDRYSYLTNPRLDYGLLLLAEGKMRYITDDDTIDVEPGDLVFLSKNSYYDVKIETDRCKAVSFLVNFDISDQNETCGCPRVILKDAAQVLIPVFNDVIMSFNRGEESRLLTESEFYRLLYNVKSMIYGKEMDNDYKLIMQAKRLLEYSHDLSVSDIAHKLSVSESGLRSKFKHHVGVSPLRYRMNLKINEAKRLLAYTDVSIKEISFSLGFYDQACFYKIFLKNVGVTPKLYRDKFHGGI